MQKWLSISILVLVLLVGGVLFLERHARHFGPKPKPIAIEITHVLAR